MLLVDNATVCRKTRACMNPLSVNIDLPNLKLWQLTRELCRGRLHAGCWIPSHDKRPSWIPPEGYTDTECRALNAAADAACDSSLPSARRDMTRLSNAARDATLWAERALATLAAGAAMHKLRYQDISQEERDEFTARADMPVAEPPLDDNSPDHDDHLFWGLDEFVLPAVGD